MVKQNRKEYMKIWRSKNKDKVHLSNAKHYLKNKDHYRLRWKKYYEKNKENILKNQVLRQEEKRKTDYSYRLRKIISHSVWSALKEEKKHKKCSIWSKLPYTPQQLKEHLESLWEPWMNWDNYGIALSKKKTWNIDHIVPQSRFNFLIEDEMMECWKLENLRPLHSIENVIKKDK